MGLHHIAGVEEIMLLKERFSIALKTAKIAVFEVDLMQQQYTFFENAEDIFGVAGEVILKDIQPYSRLSPEAYRRAVSRYFAHPGDETVISNAFARILSGKTATYEARMRAGGSDFTWCKIDVTPILREGKPVKMIGVITDISHIKRQNELLKEKATTDTFTGLYDKEHSVARMKEILSKETQGRHAFLLLDIDNFKHYNDTLGHYEGDKAIKQLANLISKTFRASDVLGRFGGDEFMILVRDCPDAAWLRQKLAPIIRVQNGDDCLTTSIGVARYPQDADTFQDLFQKADQALYHAKIKRSSVAFFSELGHKQHLSARRKDKL